MTNRVHRARRALVAAGAVLHERHSCGAWAPLGGGPCPRPGGDCPVCQCQCDQIPDGDEPEPDHYEGTLF